MVYNADDGIRDAVVELVNEETYGFTEAQHEAEIERLKRVVENTYRAEVAYNLERYGPDETDDDEGVEFEDEDEG